jgi:pSer/pThr/pTyr-binding forkhead associated (FHA) protein
VLDIDGRRYQLTGPVTVLGRGSDADVVLDDPGVSRRHAEIRVDDGDVVVRDLGSTNGTLVDGQRTPSARLSDGSTITVGRTRITVCLRNDRSDEDA